MDLFCAISVASLHWFLHCVCSFTTHVEKISTLQREINAVSRGAAQNTHLQTAHIPERTNRREWSFLPPNPSRNAQHAGHMHAVLSVRLRPPWIRLLACRSCLEMCVESLQRLKPNKVFYCPFSKIVKKAQKCSGNNLLQQTVKIAAVDMPEWSGRWQPLVSRCCRATLSM